MLIHILIAWLCRQLDLKQMFCVPGATSILNAELVKFGLEIVVETAPVLARVVLCIGREEHDL